jgi:hypothetical protein
MRNEYSRALIVIMTVVGLFDLAMSFGLGLFLDDNVAGLLAATACWSVPVLLLAQTTHPLRLPYRHGLLAASGFAATMMAFNLAPLIVGAKPHVFIPIVVTVLMLPSVAISALLQRMLFTAEERLEMRSHYSRRYQMP